MLLPPINFIFKLLQSHATVQIWLYEQLNFRIEGTIRVRHHSGLSWKRERERWGGRIEG